jgi:DNA-binding CsgD family transcriptional regulator
VQWGQVHHPSDRSLSSLPYPVLRELALAALRQAVEQKGLARHSADIATTIIRDGLSQAEVARRLQISRSAVHQRLAPARKYFQDAMQTQELPKE